MEDQIDARIGAAGASREVFTVRDNPDVVIKRVHLPSPAANFLEHFVWVPVRTTGYRDTFGRVFAISRSGRFLMMERLDDITPDHYGDSPSVPVWFQDNLPKNFGINAAGIVKIRDYAMVRLHTVLGAAGNYRAAWQRRN